jgi:hypothetical protein
MKSYSCEFRDSEQRVVTGYGEAYQAETPEAAAKMFTDQHGTIETEILVTWGLTDFAVLKFNELSEAYEVEKKEKHAQTLETFRESIIVLKKEISKLPDNADYLDLPPDLRKSLQEFGNTITATPLDDWNEDEKSVFRFWKRIKRHGINDGALENASTQTGKDSQLLTQILDEQKIQTRQLTHLRLDSQLLTQVLDEQKAQTRQLISLRWTTAMFFLWFMFHLYFLPMMQQ